MAPVVHLQEIQQEIFPEFWLRGSQPGDNGFKRGRQLTGLASDDFLTKGTATT